MVGRGVGLGYGGVEEEAAQEDEEEGAHLVGAVCPHERVREQTTHQFGVCGHGKLRDGKQVDVRVWASLSSTAVLRAEAR